MDRVLVVDDDPDVCDLIRDILGEISVEGVCVRSDREAYKVIAGLPTIRGLIVDVNLGAGTTGFDVARFARQVIPNVPVIYVTGESSRESFQAFGVPGSEFIEKPFDVDGLLGALLAQLQPSSAARA